MKTKSNRLPKSNPKPNLNDYKKYIPSPRISILNPKKPPRKPL